MKVISFSCVEKLPSLLDKSCEQTIRPAWKEPKKDKYNSAEAFKSCLGYDIHNCVDYSKPPRYEVKEKVRLYWKQRSKNQEWCSKCLNGDPFHQFPNDGCFVCGAPLKYRFKKILGEAEITEVFKVKFESEGELEGYTSEPFGLVDELAEKDGFNGAYEMISWFDKQYDLSTPKEFWVYRWRYIK